tara:strand:+ start:1334 stop:1834 length:501 start_codon:yes stop_codon:yes gene_type:complete
VKLQQNSNFLYNYSLHKPKHYERTFELANHIVFCRDKSKTIVPNSTSKNHINPRAIDILKKELKIKEILIFDKIKNSKEVLWIKGHINRSGLNYLIGRTPYKDLPIFPDMSNIYSRTKALKEVVVHTVGPKRYQSFNEENIYTSEFVGLISPLWHYLGVDVSARSF